MAELTHGAENIKASESSPESVSRLYEKQSFSGGSSAGGDGSGASGPIDASAARREKNQKAIERTIEDIFALHRSNEGKLPEERSARLVARFEKIPAFPEADPGDPLALVRRYAAITRFVTDYLGLKGQVNLYPPQIKPRSGAQIYKVAENGRVLAVLKLFKPGSVEVLRELGGITTLQGAGTRAGLGLELASPVKPLGAFRLAGTGQVAYLMEVAAGQNVYKTIRTFPHNLNREEFLERSKASVRGVAKAIAEIHDKGAKSVVSVEAKAKLAAKLLGYLSDLRTPDPSRNRSWHLSQKDYELLKSSILSRVKEFLKAPSEGTVTHGDAHPGNFYFNPVTGRITLIDVETAMESLDAHGRGIVSRGSDIGRFIEAIAVNNKVLHLNLTLEKIADLQNTFIAAYLRQSRVPYAVLEADVNFYRSKLHIAALYSSKSRTDFNDLLGSIRESIVEHK